MEEPRPSGLAAELHDQRAELIQAMIDATEALPGVTEADRRQFVAGYLDLVVHAAEGDTAPRDGYLETVIPGIKAAGMPYEYVLAQMAAVGMAIAAVVRREHLIWHAAFTRDYMARLVRQWGAP